jgi:iron complex transport system substrate-binding protein
MRLTIRCCPTLLAVLTLLSVAGLAAAASDTNPAPRRIVSLNLCTDQLVLALADRDAVRSVTWLAHDSHISTMATEAAHVPVNHGLAEEIVPLAPDLVIAGLYTTRTAVALLRRLGIPLVEVDVSDILPP